MNKPHIRNVSSRRQQRGVVGIVFGIVALFVLFGMMGWALDLAQTYDRKTELQNAADSAALAGAKQLNGTSTGITAAVAKAQAIARAHKFKFDTPVELADAMISFSNSADTPDAGWLNQAGAQSTPAGLLFIKIDTSGDPAYGQVNTMFMAAASPGIATTNTYGRAVAGRATVNLAPIAICAISPTQYGSLPHTGLAPELLEFGFRRGVGYNILELNPLGGSALKYLLNGYDVPGVGNGCSPSNSSTSNSRPLMCTGSVLFTGPMPSQVFGNTGMSATLESELNSRFNSFGGGSSCNPTTAPPDSNVRSYASGGACAAGKPCNWMTPAPTNQTATPITVTVSGVTKRVTKADLGFNPPITPAPAGVAILAADYGVLWAYNRAVQFAATPPPGGYTPYTTANWPLLYPTTSGVTPTSPTGYPAAPDTPYSLTTGPYFQAPAGNVGLPNRRILNIALVNCAAAAGPASCTTLPVLGVGKFFQTVPADLPGDIHAEFGGLVPPDTLAGEVRLFK
ncbi:MAG: pilus assembly protein TadG-related protein [Burkholderiales bacterium]